MLIALPGVLGVDVMARQRPAGIDEVTRLGERTTRQRTLTRLRSSMLDLRVFGESGVMAQAAERLDVVAGTAGVRVVDAARPGSSVVRADVAHDSVGEVLDELERLAVPPADISLARIELVGQLAKRKPNTSLVWADVVGGGEQCAQTFLGDDWTSGGVCISQSSARGTSAPGTCARRPLP